ncbi:MAG TPA: 3-oxoadipate enol-lactonase [Solirubrobacteraceae bacterium]
MTAVHYEVEGPADAAAVVLSPSLGTELSMWEAQARRLSADHRVISYDLRGHGRSPVPPGPYSIADLGADLIDLLDRLDVERASLCGISIGGMVSMWVAAHAPERVDRLVVCCSSAHIDPEGTYRERAALVREQGMAVVAEGALERWFTAGFRDAHPDLVRWVCERLLAVSIEGYAGCCEALADEDLRSELGSIRAPTLVLAGAEDPATPVEHSEAIAAGIAGSRLEVVADAAHLANLGQPEVVSDLIVDHLTKERLHE